MTNYFQNPSGLWSPKDVKELHVNDDVDSANAAHHHTIGDGIFQVPSGADFKKFKEETLARLLVQEDINSDLDARLLVVEYFPFIYQQCSASVNINTIALVDIPNLSHTVNTTGGPQQVWEYHVSLDIEKIVAGASIYVGHLETNGVLHSAQQVFSTPATGYRLPVTKEYFVTYPANTGPRTTKVRGSTTATGAGTFQVNNIHSILKGKRIQ